MSKLSHRRSSFKVLNPDIGGPNLTKRAFRRKTWGQCVMCCPMPQSYWLRLSKIWDEQQTAKGTM